MSPTAPVRCGSLALLLVLLAGYAWGLLVGLERAEALAPVLGGFVGSRTTLRLRLQDWPAPASSSAAPKVALLQPVCFADCAALRARRAAAPAHAAKRKAEPALKTLEQKVRLLWIPVDKSRSCETTCNGVGLANVGDSTGQLCSVAPYGPEDYWYEGTGQGARELGARAGGVHVGRQGCARTLFRERCCSTGLSAPGE